MASSIFYLKSPESSSTATCHDRLIPTEIMIEILKRLPTETLLKLRRVPAWSSFINDPWRFMYSMSNCIYSGIRKNSSQINLPTPYMHHHVGKVDYCFERDYEVPRSVKGLVCLKLNSSVVIYNPTTGEDVSLPRKINEDYYYKYVKYRWTSLCYDPVSNQHKVLHSFKEALEKIIYHYIFVPGSNAWRKIDHSFSFEIERHNSGDEICIDGVLYYTVIHSFQRTQHLVSFYARDERFSMVQFHPPVEDYQGPNLSEFFDRKVALVYTPIFSGNNPRIHAMTSENVDNIYLMILEGGCGWRLKEVHLPPREDLPRYGRLRFAGSIQRGELLVFAWAPDDSNTFLLFYHARNDVFWKLAKMEFVPQEHDPFIDPWEDNRICSYTPDAGVVYINDHEERMYTLDEWR
ncbi:hypothetical protein SAY87_006082 [Trapa incisa]|uniref:F-box associated beta-propeller type 3 domain-containing protein n=1 Tax=Trapa incisa TaxID=236973 RepID=A0AAN7KAB1_9MYRT|nr:hypothetical protein SAY87_006082 [Trapa incisa]